MSGSLMPMPDSSKKLPPSWLAEAIRSDHLPTLRSLLGTAMKQFGVLGVALGLRVVVDTRTILADLRWMLMKRKQPDARTALVESINASVIVACAPPQVDQEVRQNLHEMSQQTGAAPEAIWALWLEYRRQLTIVEPCPVATSATSFLSARDPSDIAFIQVSESVGAAALLTTDRDLLAADGRAMPAREIVIDLRNYAREKTVELTIIGIGTFSFRIGIQALVAAVKELPGVARPIARLPPWLHLLLVGVAIWIMASEERRQAAATMLRRLRGWLGVLLDGVLEQIDAIFTAAIDAHHRAEAAQSNILAKVQPRKLLLRQAIYLACAEATRPLSIEEIEHAARDMGYTTAAKSLGPAIVRTLRADDRFALLDAGWSLRRVAA
jgi:predicted nucleic acid-binding protein